MDRKAPYDINIIIMIHIQNDWFVVKSDLAVSAYGFICSKSSQLARNYSLLAHYLLHQILHYAFSVINL